MFLIKIFFISCCVNSHICFRYITVRTYSISAVCFKSIKHILHKKPTFRSDFFWWESACINRAENQQDFFNLMQLVKEFKEKLD